MKCKKCNKRFKLKKENKYLAKRTPTLAECFSERAIVFECFDCPACGCQNIVGIREGECPKEIEEVEELEDEN